MEELSSRVDGVKEENLRLRSENQVLGQYIENLMTASKVVNFNMIIQDECSTGFQTFILNKQIIKII